VERGKRREGGWSADYTSVDEGGETVSCVVEVMVCTSAQRQYSMLEAE